MKRKILTTTLAAGIAILTLTSYGSGPFAGGAGNRTGSAGSTANCSGGGCHDVNNNALALSITLLDNWVPVTKYTVGKTYRVLLSGVVPGTSRPRFGFQVSCVKAASPSVQAGTLSTGGRSGIAVRSSTPQLIEHTTPQTGTVVGSTVVDTVSFNWVASTSLGTVRFYAALNAVNFNGSTSGDMPNVTTAEFQEAGVGVGTISRNLIKVYPNPATHELRVPVSTGEEARISIVDATGRTVSQGAASANQLGEAVISITALPAGRYYAIVLQNGVLQYAPFMKL
jgi:hypothetical protein